MSLHTTRDDSRHVRHPSASTRSAQPDKKGLLAFMFRVMYTRKTEAYVLREDITHPVQDQYLHCPPMCKCRVEIHVVYLDVTSTCTQNKRASLHATPSTDLESTTLYRTYANFSGPDTVLLFDLFYSILG